MMNEKANRTSAQVLAQQKADHEKNPVAVIDSDAAIDAAVDAYVMNHAGGGGYIPVKFKDGKYRKASDGEELPVAREFVVPYEQIQGGWIKFNGRGNPPTRKMGAILRGFIAPERDTLGDDDQEMWSPGLNGEPADPWLKQSLVPLFDPETSEMYVFNTTSETGRSAVGKLIVACKRMRREHPDRYPVVKLSLGGFQHRDPRIGWVTTPAFLIVGKVAKDGTALPETSIADDLSDDIPF